MPRNAQTSSASGWLAVPQKILNLSSTRTRCGLRSGFSSALIFFSAAVARVAMIQLLAFSTQHSAHISNVQNCFLAGPLGFEPRQSAPKALDLPLVDGPVGPAVSS